MDGRLDEALKVLGIPAGSGREAVASAYRRLARATHPDVSPEPDAAARFAAVTAAYRVVCQAPHSRLHPRPQSQHRPASTDWTLDWFAPPANLYQPVDFGGGWSSSALDPGGARLLFGVSPVVPPRSQHRPPIVAGPVLVRGVQPDASWSSRDG